MVHPLLALRSGARGLVRTPGTALTAVLTMGVGLTAAVVVLGVLDNGLRPLPVPRGEDVVQLQLMDAQARAAAPPDLPVEQWAVGPGIEEAGVVQVFDARLTNSKAPPMRVPGAAMSVPAFRLLRTPPELGRLPVDDPADRDAVVLGWNVWQTMGASASLLGTRIEVDGRICTIIGVMPKGFGFPEKQSVWTVLPREDVTGELVARLVHGTGKQAAAQALESRLTDVSLPGNMTGPYRVHVRSWTSSRGEGGEAKTFLGLAALVALLLVVCAANVGTLLMVRATERAGFLAMHAALGAPPSQAGLQLFAEALLVALGGGAVGLAGGFAMLRWMEVNLADHWGYFWMSMEVRPSVVAGTLGAILVVAAVAGTAPALKAMHTDLRRVLAGSEREVTGRTGRRLGRWFVGAQVALSTVGLVSAAFMGWGFLGLGRLGGNLPLEQVAIGAIRPPSQRYPNAASLNLLSARLRRELLRIPAVSAASISGSIPGLDGNSAPMAFAGNRSEPEHTRAFWLAADSQFLETYGLRLSAGRTFTDADTSSTPAVVLVTASFMRRFHTRLGERIRLDGVHGEGTWSEIVGVVQDWYPENPGSRTDRIIVPLAQVELRRLYVSVRTHGDAAATATSLPGAVARVDPDLPVEMPQTLGSFVAWLQRMPRTIAAFGVLGGLAGVLVTGIGLYGVMAFQVRIRLREIGVRMAVGANRLHILREVMHETLVRIAPGLLAGMVPAVYVARYLGSMLAAAGAPTLVLLAGVVMTLLMVGILAALHPALRATRLDPMQVLRQ